jgi:hypothetical protein
MKIPVQIAEKLLKLTQGEIIPSSKAKHHVINELISEGIIELNGRIQKAIRITNNNSLFQYLQNKHGINDLEKYIEVSQKENVLRSELVSISSDSKLKSVRTFKGFLVNSYFPIQAKLDELELTIDSVDGIFQFIYDFEKFSVSPDIIIVGIENPENFRHIHKQKHLFNDIKPIFVCRYPQNQSKDLIKWLQTIPNNYLHFGDFDFAGIGIYLNEFKKHLKEKAKFFVPENIDDLIKEFGNKNRYDEQKINFDSKIISETKLSTLIKTIHFNRKGLDQEILIKIS